MICSSVQTEARSLLSGREKEGYNNNSVIPHQSRNNVPKTPMKPELWPLQ